MNYQELFRAEQLPVFQNKIFNTKAEALACKKGDILLVQDNNTGLIFNAAFDPNLLVYDTDYQNEQACSVAFQHHLDDVKIIIANHFINKKLIEIGCGKGYFLEQLRQSGYQITGIDPAYEGTCSYILKTLFEPRLGLSGDGIILRHVLEHIFNPVEFLSNIAKANSGKGLIYIEVPCFDWICQHHAWFDVFYEHANYFRLIDLERMFGTVIESGHLFGGQYLYLIADLATLKLPRATDEDIIDFPRDFLSSVQRYANFCKASYTTEQYGTERIGVQRAIWGSASKGVIFALYMKNAGVTIDLAIDINPAKQGKFLGASGLPVLLPENAMAILRPRADIFIMNSNYLNEIIAESNNQFNYITVDHNEF